MLDPDEELQEMNSNSSDDDDDRSELRGRIQMIKESGAAAGIASPEFTSPIGSPRDDEGVLSAKGRFMALKRIIQDDLDSSSHRSPAKGSKSSDRKSRKKTRAVAVPGGGRDTEDFEDLGEECQDWAREGSVSPPQSYHDDVEELLESFRSMRGAERGDHSIRVDNHPKLIEVSLQLRDRDMKILGLESRVMELDRQVIDLQDTLNERDKLLGSKNEAVNCVANQYQHEILEKDAELIKTQDKLFELERKFGAAQEQWKTDKDRLNTEIRQQNTRLKDLEDTNKLLESARLQLTSNSLELEEKLSVLKEDRNKLTQENSKIIIELEEIKSEKGSLEKNLRQKTEEYDISISELKGSLEKSAEQMTKMKQQFQAKLKAMKEKMKENSTGTDANDGLQAKIGTLENRIAELEEEKGNLLLVQEELTQVKSEIETQEKESLILVQNELSKVQSEKVSLEKDFMERLGEYEKNFEERVEEYEKKIEECDKKIEDDEKIIHDLNTSVEKSKEQMTKMKRLFQTKLKAAKEGQSDNNTAESEVSEAQVKITFLENRVAELEEEKGNHLWLQEELTQIKSEKETLEKSCEDKSIEYEKRIEELSDLLEKSTDQINRLEQQSQVSISVASDEPRVSNVESEVQQTRITTLEHQVAELEEEKGSGFLLEEELTRIKSEREASEKSFEEKSAQYESKIEDLNAALTKSTELMTKMKRQFQARLKAMKEDRKESPSSSELEVELLAKITALENRVAELEVEKGNLLLTMVDFDEQQASREGVTQDSTGLQVETIKLEINLAEKEEELRLVQEQLNELTAALSQKNGEVEQLMKNCSEMQQSLQQKVDELSGSVNAKEEEIRRVIQDYDEDHRLATERIAVLELEASVGNDQLASKDMEIQTLTEKLTDAEKRHKETAVFVNQYQDMLEGARDQDQNQLISLQQELETIKQKATLAEQSYETMKSGYSEEMNLRLKTISELQEQLNHSTLDLSIRETECCEIIKTSAELQQRLETAEIQFRNSDTEYRNQIEQLNTKLASYEVEIEQLTFVTDNYQKSLESQAFSQERENRQKVVEEELRNQLIEKDTSIDSLNSRFSALEIEKSQLTAQLSEENDSLKTKISELSNTSDTLQRELTALRELYVDTDASYNELTSEFHQKSVELDQLIGADNQSKTLLEQLQNEIANQHKLFEDNRVKASIVENEKAQLESRMEEVMEENKSLTNSILELTNDYGRLRESFESKDVESQRLREDANTLQSEYADTNNELKLKISTLMDELNNYENEISVVTARLKESDDSAVDVKARHEELSKEFEENRQILDSKSKALEAAENSIFEKTEELVRLEERLREIDEKHRLAVEENFVKYSDDLDATYDQLAKTANDNVNLQAKLKEREKEMEDVSAQLSAFTAQHSNHDLELNDYRERINYLENQLMSAGRQLEEVKSNEDRESMKVVQLQRELVENQLRLQELTVELEEARNLRVNTTTATVLQQTPVPDQQYSNHFADLTAGLEARDRRIYELEVQLTELQIAVDDANIQMAELSELKTSLEVISYKLKESEENNSKLKYELDQLINERSRHLQKFLDMEAISGSPVPSVGPTPSSAQVPVDEEIVRATAYTTTDTSIPMQEEQRQGTANQEQLQQSLRDIKELKVKNGKMIQRFKQLKDKYEAVVKENEGLKTKKQFSLDSAFEDEFFSQVQQKEALLDEKVKLIADLQSDNQRMSEKLDLLERGTERLTDMKEEQDRSVQELLNQRRGLETEVSALKWKVEELENISLNRAGSSATGEQGSDNAYFDISVQDQVTGENVSLRQQNYVMSQELQALQVEIESQKKSVDELNERNQQLEEEIERLQEFQIEQRHTIETRSGSVQRNTFAVESTNIQMSPSPDVVDAIVSPINYSVIPSLPNPSLQTLDSTFSPSETSTIAISTEPQALDNRIDSLQQTLQSEQNEKLILERKIELLQSKISEIEISEMKCFEESLMLKSWTRQLELDNLKIQRELERIYSSVQEGDTGNLKVKVLQDEVVRLVDALHDRDKRCEELTMEITRLLEERDTLQLKLSNVLRHNVTLHEEANKGREPPSTNDIPSYDKQAIQMKLAELEQITYSMGIDLRREREARRLVQEQLFFSTSSRIYPSSGKQSQSPPGRGSPAPSSSPYQLRPNTPQQSHSPTTAAVQQQYFQPLPVTPPSSIPVQTASPLTIAEPEFSLSTESSKPSSLPVMNI